MTTTNQTHINFQDQSAGTIINGQYSAQGVTISSLNHDGSIDYHNPPMVFDSAHPTGGDYDLATSNLGNVLILSEDRDSHDPDDNAHGGTFKFDFDGEVTVNSITLLDVEEGAWIKVYDEHGNLLKQIDAYTANNGQKDVHIGVEGAAYMTIKLAGSGAVDNLKFTPALSPDGVVNGTSEGELIDINYVDAQGDRIDANDALGVEGTIGDEDLVLAGGGNDTVYAGVGDDIVRGEGGNDKLFGQSGNDVLEGGDGCDTLIGGSGNDTLDGGAHNDEMWGGTGDDLMNGGTGNDWMHGEDGNDTLNGGEGHDMLFGEAGTDVLNGDGGDDRLSGGTGNDTINGGTGNDTVYGGDGNDSVEGGAGHDRIEGNNGADTIDGGDGDDLIVGYDATSINDGNTAVHEDDGSDDVLIGGFGDDTILGGGGNDTIIGDDEFGRCPDGASEFFQEWAQDISNVVFYFDTNGDGAFDVQVKVDDFPDSGSGNFISNDIDDFYSQLAAFAAGEAGLDGSATILGISIKGGIQTTEFFAVEGNSNGDLPDPGPTNNTGPGNDAEVSYGDFYATYDPAIGGGTGSGSFNDALFGGDGNDRILGDKGSDTIDGGAGADDLFGGDDRDVFVNVTAGDVIKGGEGGDDFDTLDLTGANAAVEYLNGDPATEAGTIYFLDDHGVRTGETASFIEIENVIGAVTERDGIITGDATDDLIDGTFVDEDNEVIDGGDALLPGEAPDDDIVTAGAGDDTVLSGAGDDEVFGEDGNDLIDAGVGDDFVDGGAGNDTIDGGDGQDTLLGGDGDDSISGSDDNDLIDGGTGNDTISGGGGNDTIDGGAGDDSITGSGNDDLISGGDGADTIRGDGGTDTIDGGDGDDRILGGKGNDDIQGGAGNDSITGGDGTDTIDGGAGEDTIEGGTGNDSILGGDDNDTIRGNGGDDTLDGGAGDDSVSGSANDDLLFGGDGNDDVSGSGGNDTLDGGAGDDEVRGGKGDDDVSGGAGDDIVTGGDGNDMIDGGSGNDTITGGDGLDMIDGGDDRDLILGATTDDMIDGGSGGDDFDTLDLTGSDVAFITYTSADREDGIITFRDDTTAKFEDIEAVIPCFTPGTLIATPKGEVAVETLEVGDRVITRDNGIQVIRWVGKRDMTAVELTKNGALRAVMIRAGALGHGLPERDMVVSPQHRVLIANDETMLYFDEREVLVAAKHLVGRPGVERMQADDVTYIHVMFDNHEVILSDGAWTESFQPGDHSLKGLGKAQREEIFAIFPELREQEGREEYTAARRMLKRQEAELLLK